MIRTRFWRAPNLVAYLMHTNSTWSSPSGWFKSVVHREFHRLWLLLGFLSILPFIAVPLSGLVFEITDGFIKTSDAPSVQGRNRTNFNEKYDTMAWDEVNGYYTPARDVWLVGLSPRLPGLGVIYTNDAVDRAEFEDFAEVPNSFPLTKSIPDLFLPPQSDKPMSGKVWGLRVKYDCKIVESVSEFTVLSQKAESSIVERCDNAAPGNCIILTTPSGGVITPWNETAAGNVGAYFESGVSKEGTRGAREDKYNGEHPDFEAEEGENSLVFEYAAWQFRRNDTYGEDRLVFDNSVGPSVAGLGSPLVKQGDDYAMNSTFFTVRGDPSGNTTDSDQTTDLSQLMNLDNVVNYTYGLLDVAAPIGVRCVASSALGHAEVDAQTSSFRDFERADPDFHPTYGYGSERFGFGAQYTLNTRFLQHYISGGLSGTEALENSNRYLQFLNADALLRSVNLAYANDAYDLIYGVASGYQNKWTAEGMTSSREGRILVGASLIPGAGVGYFVLALFCLWSALSTALGLLYGFRRRPVEKLSGYEMLREGAERADELKANPEFMNREQFLGNKTLARMPGS